jgi:hypothetical protein
MRRTQGLWWSNDFDVFQGSLRHDRVSVIGMENEIKRLYGLLSALQAPNNSCGGRRL